MTDEKLPPIWLLDVDGVINASRPGWGAAPRTGYAYAGRSEFKIRWAPALLQRIRKLHSEGLVEIQWCTTWCAFADQLERLFKLPPLGRAFTEEINGRAAAAAKLSSAWSVL